MATSQGYPAERERTPSPRQPQTLKVATRFPEDWGAASGKLGRVLLSAG
jgi:hypothetical protein